ncbi:uncharacterized protein [Nicotiana sylvestris]|uniref:uncharacterized protein n=1 Tax=Nicotiana sylvestris TaxID=4096 RepID=UPI00388C70D8
MEIGTERIMPNSVYVRAFDGIKRDTIVEIDLILTIGPVDFEVTFQVLDMDTSYNFLLGRPWIHAAGAVRSTLHQMVKFEHEDQEIVVHGEDKQSIYRDPSVPCPEAREGSEHIVYQAFEVMAADQCEEGSPCPQPFLSNALIMVTNEIIKHGYKPRKGLGESLQGIMEPITLTASKTFFGVGFQATEADVKWDKKCKNDGWVLPLLVLHLSKTFVKLKYTEEEEEEEEEDESFTAVEIEDICESMRVMPFGLKNVGATYMRAMTAIFHDMMHQEIEVYVDDVIIKSRMQNDHVRDLRKFFEHLCKYDFKLNPAKCAFGVPYGNLLGFIVS